jgi:sulfur-oxidizing protein SoxZ
MLSRVQVPHEARRGEVIAIRIVIQHAMETGFRPDSAGRLVPRNVINHFSCRYNGAEVFDAELSSGIAANPYLEFYTVAQASGEFEFHWVDDSGEEGSARQPIQVHD